MHTGLAHRAYGIELLRINSGPWRDATFTYFTESSFFCKQQLAYLMGQLRHKKVELKTQLLVYRCVAQGAL